MRTEGKKAAAGTGSREDDPDRIKCSIDELPQAVQTIRNRGVLGGYDGFPNSLRQVAWDTNPQRFVEKMQALQLAGQILNPSNVVVMTALSEEGLFHPDWERRLQAAVGLIREARNRGNERTLRVIRGALRRSFSKPGPRTKVRTHEEMIKVLKRLMNGEKEKDIAGGDEQSKQLRALLTDIGRFCKEVYEVWNAWYVFNSPDDPGNWHPVLQKYLKESCNFNFPGDEPVVRFAVDRFRDPSRKKAKRSRVSS